MTECPLYDGKDAPCDEWIETMNDHRIIQIPLVSELKFLDMIFRTDIFRHVLEPEQWSLCQDLGSTVSIPIAVLQEDGRHGLFVKFVLASERLRYRTFPA